MSAGLIGVRGAGMFGISGSEVVVLVVCLAMATVFVVGLVTVARWLAGKSGQGRFGR